MSITPFNAGSSHNPLALDSASHVYPVAFESKGMSSFHVAHVGDLSGPAFFRAKDPNGGVSGLYVIGGGTPSARACLPALAVDHRQPFAAAGIKPLDPDSNYYHAPVFDEDLQRIVMGTVAVKRTDDGFGQISFHSVINPQQLDTQSVALDGEEANRAIQQLLKTNTDTPRGPVESLSDFFHMVHTVSGDSMANSGAEAFVASNESPRIVVAVTTEKSIGDTVDSVHYRVALVNANGSWSNLVAGIQFYVVPDISKGSEDLYVVDASGQGKLVTKIYPNSQDHKIDTDRGASTYLHTGTLAESERWRLRDGLVQRDRFVSAQLRTVYLLDGDSYGPPTYDSLEAALSAAAAPVLI